MRTAIAPSVSPNPIGERLAPREKTATLSALRVYGKKKPPESVSQPGELVIRVHLPIKCSQVEDHTPDQFVQRSVIFFNKKTPVGVSLLGE